jgi:malonyl-CoA/methylmalonyl-CoA synthetase
VTLPIIDRASTFGGRTAIVAPEGSFSFRDLTRAADVVAARLLAGGGDLEGERVCFLAPPGWVYAAVQWGIWRAGGVAVPLAVSHPPAELAHVIDDADPVALIVHPDLVESIAAAAGSRTLTRVGPGDLEVDRAGDVGTQRRGVFPELATDRPAMILYTSGTTGRPKGAVISHANIQAQVESLSRAWGWSAADRTLLHLPLHHVHGIVNVLTCALWNGAVCEIMPIFRPVEVWRRLAMRDVTVYMAVPTVYARLIDAWDAAGAAERIAWSEGARACRLMVSGSAALPVQTLERWEAITGHRLLERYGMTEIGMALSNPLDGERRAGFVGHPLPGVEVRLADERDVAASPGSPGEIQVKGPTVFGGYWRRPGETAGAFTADGWFRTGDLAVVEDGAYRILGRASVDILKTGGEKISALEIEDVLRSHARVADCAVVGVADVEWGERVCAAVVPRHGSGHGELSEAELRTFVKSRLAPYKVPKHFILVPDLPRNAMGKVTKPAVRELFAGVGR